MRISLIHGLRSYLSYPNSQTISLFLKEKGKNVLAKSLLLMSMTSAVAVHATAQVSVSQTLGDSAVVVPKRPAPLIWEEKEYLGAPWVSPISRPYTPTAGLQGRHIFLWPSHGRYYNAERWAWQRPILFCTTEDLLTPTFVFPYLIPMLERAGAIVYSARERDAQTNMAVVDNDQPSRDGDYIEDNAAGRSWQTANVRGFSMPLTTLNDNIQPFSLGTVRSVATTQGKDLNSVTWMP